MGDGTRMRDQAPTRRAAVAGVLVAGALLALVAVAALWARPASVPTYAADAWTGDGAVTVRSAVEVRASGPFAACPTIWLPDGSRAGALLVEGWAASIPGVAFPERLPALRPTADGLRLGDSLNVDAAPVEVRVLDPAVADDAGLIEAYAATCGSGSAVAMVAPDAVLESLALLP